MYSCRLVLAVLVEMQTLFLILDILEIHMVLLFSDDLNYKSDIRATRFRVAQHMCNILTKGSECRNIAKPCN